MVYHKENNPQNCRNNFIQEKEVSIEKHRLLNSCCSISSHKYIGGVIIISCHQTIFFHRSVHAWAVSLNSRMSSKVQGCARNEHCNMWAVFSVASPHSHVVYPLKYPHFFLCSLLLVYPVLSLFRHLQLSQGISYPVARSSYRLTKPACTFASSLLFHSLTRTTFAGKWTGCTLVRKLLLDFRRLLAGVCPNREWVSLSLYLFGSFHSCPYTSSDFRRGNSS